MRTWIMGYYWSIIKHTYLLLLGGKIHIILLEVVCGTLRVSFNPFLCTKIPDWEVDVSSKMYYTDIAFIYLAVLVFVGRIREPFGRFAGLLALSGMATSWGRGANDPNELVDSSVDAPTAASWTWDGSSRAADGWRKEWKLTSEEICASGFPICQR